MKLKIFQTSRKSGFPQRKKFQTTLYETGWLKLNVRSDNFKLFLSQKFEKRDKK